MATFLAALNLVDILIFQRCSISRSPVFLSGFQLLKHLSSGTAVLKARRTNQKMKGQAWRKVPSGISSPAPAFRSVGISQKSLPQILSHPSYLTQSQNILILPGNYLNSIAWQYSKENTAGCFFLAASREHWQNKKCLKDCVLLLHTIV